MVCGDAVVASHPQLFGRDQTHCDWRHYILLAERKPGVLRNGAPFADLPTPLRQLQRTLLRREGGDWVMVRGCWPAVPAFGLEAVLVAVELVMESGTPSVERVLKRCWRA